MFIRETHNFSDPFQNTANTPDPFASNDKFISGFTANPSVSKTKVIFKLDYIFIYVEEWQCKPSVNCNILWYYFLCISPLNIYLYDWFKRLLFSVDS